MATDVQLVSQANPGPWRLCSNEQDREFHIVDADGLPVATVETTIASSCAKWSNKRLSAKELWQSVANEREQANASLIAAAREMADALRAILFQLTQGDKVFDRDACITQARAAYIKATGGKS
jgi:NAD(P)H-hydrate repair Nnr-like enzyme with NAD(P)H-hydrate dehydratase domain